MTTPTWEEVRAHIDVNTTKLGDGGCWLWTLPLTDSGYGRFYGDGAHRLAYMAYVGPIGKGLDIDHLCRNRACVNPKHLEPVTRQENLRRGIRTEQQRIAAASRTHCSAQHELTAENTYLRPSDGARLCRICRRGQDAKDREKNREIINHRKRQKRRELKEGKVT